MGRDNPPQLANNSRGLNRSRWTVPDAMDLWEQQEGIRREVEETLELQDGKSIQELVKEANQRLRVARAPSRRAE